MTVAVPPATGAVTGGLSSLNSKVTVPVGAPAAGASGVIFATNVVDCPTVAGSGVEASSVVVSACWTVWVVVSREVVKLVSP
ncbi:hypothetical protein, partial [Streptomyces decoyicus]